MYTNTLLTALNLIQVEVVFNQEVEADSAEDADNYTVEDMTIADAALQADMKTVVLTLTANTNQQDALDVTVDAVETAEEVALEEVVFEEVAFLDTTIPTVVSAEVVGIDTIKVTFSEPMTKASLEAKANYSVDGGDLYINTVVAVNNNTEANITLYSDLEEGDVTVKVKAAVEDEAGFGVVQNTLTATVVEDKDAPIVVGFKDATTTGVTLIFNEEIEISVLDKENYYHTNSANYTKDDLIVADVLSSDGKELTLDFSDAELPEGTAYLYILKESVNDLWDNENAQIMFKVEITVDVTAPEVDSVKVKTEEKIEVKFTEAVVKADAEDEDNYTILDKNGDEVKDIIDDINYASKVATIEFNDTLSGQYSIVIKNIEDPAENEIATVTVDFDVDDLTAPLFTDFTATVYNTGATNQMIRIVFGEEMNAEGNYSVVDPANYTINGTPLTDLVDDYDAEISLVDNGKAVQITAPIDTSTTSTPNGVDLVAGTGAANGIVLARVSDVAGNYTVAYTGTIDIDAASTVGIESVEITAVDTVVVTFDDLLDEFTADDVVVRSATSDTVLPIAKRAISMNSDGNTVLTFTLTEDLTYNAKAILPAAANGQSVEVAIVAPITSENKFGEKLGIEIVVADDKTAAELNDDGVATILNSWEDYLVDSGTNEFTVQFSENIATSNTDLLGNDLVVKADNDTLVLGVDYTVTLATDTLTFTLIGDLIGFTGEVSVERAATTNYLTDIAGNDVDAFDTGDCDIATAITLVAYNAAIANVTEADYTVVTWTAYQVIVAANVVTITDKQVDINTATAAITAAQANLIAFADLAEVAVAAYEALNLTDDANIATSVAAQVATKLTATTAVALAPAGTQAAFNTRISDEDVLILAANTITTVTVASVTLTEAGGGETVVVTAIAKNAAAVTLTTNVVYAWTVTNATDNDATNGVANVADLGFSAQIAGPTVTKTPVGDVTDVYEVTVSVTNVPTTVPVTGAGDITMN